MPQSEREFQAAVIEYAQLNGWLVHHGRAAQVREGKWVTPIQGDAGFPDLVMVRGRWIVFVELKSEKGRIAKAQQRWRDDLEWAIGWSGYKPALDGIGGTVYFLWRPSDWDEIETTLRRTT
jgi:hypothetical protein